MTWCFPPRRSVFRGPRFQSASLTVMNSSSFSHSPHWRGEHWHHPTYPTAASWVAVTGLSYPAIPQGCPCRYRPFQVSPYGLKKVSLPACSPPVGTEWHPLEHPSVGIFTPSPAAGFLRFQRLRAFPFGPFPRRPSSPDKGGLGRMGHCSPKRPSQPYERNCPHTATAYAQPGLVVPAWPDG